MNVPSEKYIKNVKKKMPEKQFIKDYQGLKLEKQRYECKNCKYKFITRNELNVLKAYEDYTIHKFTYSELEEKYGKSAKTIRRHFDNLDLAELKGELGDKKGINLVFYASHFKREFCLFLFRSGGENIHYDFKDSEKIIYYEDCLKEISKKYKLSSFTIDGRRGVIQLLEKMFPSVPIQLCQFHLVKNVLKYTTRKPKRECGKELRKLILELKTSTEESFTNKYIRLKEKYKEFLSEKNESEKFVHGRLRSAFNSIKTQMPYLFTFEKFPSLKIERTTNSCDGYFSHLKAKVNIHRGITARGKIQLIIKLYLLNSGLFLSLNSKTIMLEKKFK